MTPDEAQTVCLWNGTEGRANGWSILRKAPGTEFAETWVRSPGGLAYRMEREAKRDGHAFGLIRYEPGSKIPAEVKRTLATLLP